MDPRIPTADELNAMSAVAYRTVENRCRRAAHRQGLHLERSRSRDVRSVDYGTYHLINLATHTLEYWGLPGGYGLGLDDIAEVLWGPRQ
jgi:hypothetical protein